MLDFLRAPPRRFVYLSVRLQRHELPSLISAAGFDLSCDLVQSAGRPLKNCAGRRRRARLFSFSYVARHRNHWV
jgi:hypothetical protein